jgi:hypothetical protein
VIVVASVTNHDAVPDVGLARDREGLVGPGNHVGGQPLGALLVGDAGPEFAHDRERMDPEPLLDEAAVPESVQTLARAAPRADVIAAPVVPGRSVQGLVDVADPMAQELERRQLLLVGRVRGCQDGEVVLDRAGNPAECGCGALSEPRTLPGRAISRRFLPLSAEFSDATEPGRLGTDVERSVIPRVGAPRSGSVLKTSAQAE